MSSLLLILSLCLAPASNGDVTGSNGSDTYPLPESGGLGGLLGTVTKATIGPEGGTLTSADDLIVITVPEGALQTRLELTLQPVANLVTGTPGNSYLLGPKSLAFTSPAILSFKHTTVNPGIIRIEGAGLLCQDKEGWFWVDQKTMHASRPIQTASDVDYYVLRSDKAVVNKGEKVELKVLKCKAKDVDAKNCKPLPGGPLAPLTETWKIDDDKYGNPVGAILGKYDSAVYTAPDNMITPHEVTVTVNNITAYKEELQTYITINPGYFTGKFTATATHAKLSNKSFEVKGILTKTYYADIDKPHKGNGDYNDFTQWSMAGTVTMQTTQFTEGDTCRLKDSAKKDMDGKKWVIGLDKKGKNLGWRGDMVWMYTCKEKKQKNTYDIPVTFYMGTMSGKLTNLSTFVSISPNEIDTCELNGTSSCESDELKAKWTTSWQPFTLKKK
jgi:hypothetical protein